MQDLITSFFKQLLPLLTILAQLIFVAIILILFTSSRKKTQKILAFIRNNSSLFALVIALVSTLGSLFYSEIAGYEPCKLCWYQRILMYPQTALLAVALWTDDHKISRYILPLSFTGLLASSYHYLLQVGFLPPPTCSTVGFSISCSDQFLMQYGYITIPMMALTAFALITLLMLISRLKRPSDH